SDRVFLVAAEKFLIGADDPIGSSQQAFALRVITGPADQRADRLERLVARRPADTALPPGARFHSRGTRQGFCNRHDVLFPGGSLPVKGGAPPPWDQLRRIGWPAFPAAVGWCGLSRENAGICTRKLSPPFVCIS